MPTGFLPGANITEVQAARELGRIDGWREIITLIFEFSREPESQQDSTNNNNLDNTSYARSDDFKP